jgi:hypothetical protein
MYSDLSYAQAQLICKLKRKRKKLVAMKNGTQVTYGLVPFEHMKSVGVYEAINSSTAAKLVDKGYVIEQPGVNIFSTIFYIPKTK